MSAYIEKQKLLDWLDKLCCDWCYHTVEDVIEEINSGIFDWQPND